MSRAALRSLPALMAAIACAFLGGDARPAVAQTGCGCEAAERAVDGGVSAAEGLGAHGCRSELGWCARPKLLYESPLQTWYADAGVTALRRDAQNENQAFATLGTPTNVVLGGDDFDFDNRGGLRLLIGNRLSDTYAVEGSYLGKLEWDETESLRNTTANAQGTTGNLFSPFTNFGSPAAQAGLDFNNFAAIHTTSSLENVELSLRQRLETPPSIMQASILYGVRYMTIEERFDYRTQSLSPAAAGTENMVNVDTGNQMLGFQIGGMADFVVDPRWYFNVEGKAALCRNEASQQTRYTVGPLAGPGVLSAGEREESRSAFVGDLALSVAHRFSPILVGRIGYQALIVDGLALASENFESNVAVLTTGPAELVRDGTVVYHGPFIGLTATW